MVDTDIDGRYFTLVKLPLARLPHNLPPRLTTSLSQILVLSKIDRLKCYFAYLSYRKGKFLNKFTISFVRSTRLTLDLEIPMVKRKSQKAYVIE